MKLLITLLLLLCHNCVRSLPVQSQALENVDDQFFWQQAWFSSNDKPDSPFTSGDSKKITAKSIFITPNLVKPQPHYCPSGYLIDDNGKCNKIESFQQPSEEILKKRLINLIATDDFDYDYDDGEPPSDEQLSNLPALVPILNENSEDDGKGPSTETSLQYFLEDGQKDDLEIVITTLSNDNETVSYEHATAVGENENITEKSSGESFTESFLETSSQGIKNYSESSLSQNNEELSQIDDNKNSSELLKAHKNLNSQMEEIKNSSEVLKPQISENTQSLSQMEENKNSSELLEVHKNQNSQTDENKTENSQTLHQSQSESSEKPFESSVMTLEKILYGKFEEFLKESNKNLENASKIVEKAPEIFKSSSTTSEPPTTNTDVDIYSEQSTDAAISESSDTINSDADNAFLLNDSLIIVDDKNNSSDFDYSEITTLEPFGDFEVQKEEEKNSNVPTTPRDDRQNENKFVYHHLTEPTTTTMAAPLSTTELANKLLRFPSNDEVQQRHRVRFPDDDEEIITTPRPTSFSWPRESNTPSGNNGGVPNKLHITRFWNEQPFMSDYGARGNSKNFRMNFLPYTRKVQILTPQRYNYRK